MLLSVIIVNYNVAGLVENCIESFIQKIQLTEQYEIIVVDNNSIERAIEHLPERFPRVKFIFNKKNLGFGEANNQAIKQSKGEYILFLNPDTLIIEDFVNPIINFVRSSIFAGACGPMLINADHSYQNSTGIRLGYIYEISEALMLINILRFFYKNLLFKKMKKNNPVKVSWLSAACMLISKTLLMEIDGFNTDFFLNYEDIDLCDRIRKSGHNIYYFHSLRCIHLDQKSQTKNFDNLVFSRYYSRKVYAEHHYSSTKKILIKNIHLLGLLLRLIVVRVGYKGIEKKQRLNGYKKAIRFYLR